MAKSSYYYRPQFRKPKPLDPVLVQALNEMSGTKEDQVYGYRKKTWYVNVHGLPCNHKKVYRHLKAAGKLQPRKHKGYRYTELAYWRPTASNQRWETDLSETPCGIDGKGFGIAVKDCYDRQVIAEIFSQRCRALEVQQVIWEAVHKRFTEGQVPPALTLVLRIDRGGQFIARDVRALCQRLDLQLEVCGIQTPNDKPYIESFFSSYKTEEVHRNWYRNFDEAQKGWKEYIAWYNHCRYHQGLKYKTPDQVAPMPVVRTSLEIVNRLISCQAKSTQSQPSGSPV
jgi:transposase InsO family protein